MDCSKQIYQHKAMKENESNDLCDSISIESSFEGSIDSLASSFSSDILEDATSSTSSSSSSPSYGPLYDLFELMEQLPIKRGLSKYYQGKSQSFATLTSVKSLEELAKKESPYRKKMKSCNSYGRLSPKPNILKKGSTSRGSFLSSLGNKRGTFVGAYRFPTSVQKNF